MKITIEGCIHPDRRVELELPASDEQVRQAFDKLTEGLPKGEGFPYRITSAMGIDGPATLRVQENSDVRELNLLSYMLENIRQDFRGLALWIADAKTGPEDIHGFINEIAAVKSGWYQITEEAPGQQDGGRVVDGRYVANYDSQPDVYRRPFVKDWLETERREYEQQQTVAPDESPQMGGMTL